MRSFIFRTIIVAIVMLGGSLGAQIVAPPLGPFELDNNLKNTFSVTNFGVQGAHFKVRGEDYLLISTITALKHHPEYRAGYVQVDLKDHPQSFGTLLVKVEDTVNLNLIQLAFKSAVVSILATKLEPDNAKSPLVVKSVQVGLPLPLK